VAFEAPDLPEGLTVDRDGTVYVGMATSGEIRRLRPDGSRSTLATLRPGLGSLLGLAVDPQGNVLEALASQNTPGSDRYGIWQVAPDGTKTLRAALPTTTMPNALAFGPDGTLFVLDSMRGSIWSFTSSGRFSRWVQHDLLEGDLQACPPPALTGPVGANGLVYDPAGSLLVANTTKAQIVRVHVEADGSAGTPKVAYGPDCQGLAGADGLARDTSGQLYVALNWQHRVIRLDPNGEPLVVATRADGLDFPASLAWSGGRLYFTNYAQLSFLRRESPRPSLMTLDGR
jgi:sugar lactone lactonase YvrE